VETESCEMDRSIGGNIEIAYIGNGNCSLTRCNLLTTSDEQHGRFCVIVIDKVGQLMIKDFYVVNSYLSIKRIKRVTSVYLGKIL